MRDLRRWIYAGLATFLVGGVLGLAGADNFIAGGVGVMVFVTVYSALQRMDGNRKTAVRDAGERTAALASVPAAGQGVVYVYRTGFMAKLLGINVSVDGVAEGQLVSPRSMQIVLPAGRHELTASTAANNTKAAEPLIIDLSSGSIVIVELQIQGGMAKNILRLRLDDNTEAARQRLATMPMIAKR